MLKHSIGGLLASILLTSPGISAPAPAKPPANTELHVVSIYQGAPGPAGGPARVATVVVDRPDKEVTLVLSANEPVTWEVTATAKTKVKKVILAGYHKQSANLPKGAEQVDYFYEGREGKPYMYMDYRIDSSRFRTAIQTINELTRQEVKSFRGAPKSNPADPFTVDAIQDDPRLASGYPWPTPAADLPKVKFQAVYFAPKGGHDVASSYGDFAATGPDRDSLKPMPNSIRRLAFDPKGKKYYGLTMHEVHEVDVQKRTSTKMDPGDSVPRINWPSAITFDTKRDRLLVFASRAIYEYVPATEKWSVMLDLPRGPHLTAIAYHAKDDNLYGLGQEFGDESGQPILHQMNNKGALLKSTELPAPMFAGILGRYGPESRAQLISTGNYLAVVVGGAPQRDGSGKPTKAESFLFLIDPTTEKVTLGWKE
jgi:hypothetical protein